MLVGIAPRIDLLLEIEQHQVPGLMRAEPGDFDIIMQQVWIPGDRIVFAGKELLLEIKARAPGQVAADFQVLPLAMPVHVGWEHPFSWLAVMGAAGGVNMVVARPPAQPRWIDP